jgi:hypothetical protein
LTNERENPIIKGLHKFLGSSLKADDSARVDKIGELRKAVKVLLSAADLKSWLVLVKLMLCVDSMEPDLSAQLLSIRYFWSLRDNMFPSKEQIHLALDSSDMAEGPEVSTTAGDSAAKEAISGPGTQTEQQRLFGTFANGAQWMNQSIQNYKEAMEVYENYVMGTIAACSSASGDSSPTLTRCSQFIGPDPFNFLLINSCLRQILSNILSLSGTGLDVALTPNAILATNLLSTLEVNFTYILNEGLSLSMLGLKYHHHNAATSSSSSAEGDSGSPLVGRLLHTLLIYARLGGSSIQLSASVLLQKIASQAIETLSAGMTIFFPQVSDWIKLLKSLSEPAGPVDSALLDIFSISSLVLPTSLPSSVYRTPNSTPSGSPSVLQPQNISTTPDTVLSSANCTALLLSLPTVSRRQILCALCRHLRSPKSVSLMIPSHMRVVTSALAGIHIQGSVINAETVSGGKTSSTESTKSKSKKRGVSSPAVAIPAAASVDGPVSEELPQRKLSDHIIRYDEAVREPRVGDNVVPGPDWKYPSEYLPDVYGSFISGTGTGLSAKGEGAGETIRTIPTASIGVVVDIVDWELNARKGVIVLWRNGERHVYNCGHNNRYEVSLYLNTDQVNEQFRQAIKDTKPVSKIPLSALYTPEYVSRQLQDLSSPAPPAAKGFATKQGSRSNKQSAVSPASDPAAASPASGVAEDPNAIKLTKRGVFEFIVKHAPDHFLDTYKLRRNMQNLVKASDVQQTIKVYTQFYRCMANLLANSTVNPPRVSPQADTHDLCAYEVLRALVLLITSPITSRQSSPAVKVGDTADSDCTDVPATTELDKEASETLSVMLKVLTGQLACGQIDNEKLSLMKLNELKALLRRQVTRGELRIPSGRPDSRILDIFVNIIGFCSTQLAMTSEALQFPLFTDCLGYVLSSLCTWQMLPSPTHHKELYDAFVVNVEQLYRFLVAATKKIAEDSADSTTLTVPKDRTIKFCSSLRSLSAFLLGRIAGDLIHGGSVTETIGNDYVSLHSHVFERYSQSFLPASKEHKVLPASAASVMTVIGSKLFSRGFREQASMPGSFLGRNDAVDSAYSKLVNSTTSSPAQEQLEPTFAWLQQYRKFSVKLPDNVREAMMSVFLCHVYHGGSIDAVLSCNELLQVFPEAVKLVPPRQFLEAWSAVEAVRNNYLAKKRAQQQPQTPEGSNKVSSALLADEYLHSISQRAQFLLRIEVAQPPTSIGRKISATVKKLQTTVADYDPKVIDNLLRLFDDETTYGHDRTISGQVDAFLNATKNFDKLSLVDIHKHLVFVNERASSRARGFHVISQALTALSSTGFDANEQNSSHVDCRDIVCMLAQYGPALRTSGDGSFHTATAYLLSSVTTTNASPATGATKQQTDSDCRQLCHNFTVGASASIHFMEGIASCDLTSSKTLLHAYERIMTSLINTLMQAGSVVADASDKSAVTQGDLWKETMLSLIGSCAVAVKDEEDDNVLKQVHVFDHLKVTLS